MKSRRQEKIVALVTKYDIETQEDLIGMLKREGYAVTQATVSRDIRELKLTKTLTSRGSYRYMLPVPNDGKESNIKFNTALIESIRKVAYSGNIIVLTTYSGLANAVATGLDALESPDILGCVAGDDTIIVVTKGSEFSKEISERIKIMLRTL